MPWLWNGCGYDSTACCYWLAVGSQGGSDQLKIYSFQVPNEASSYGSLAPFPSFQVTARFSTCPALSFRVEELQPPTAFLTVLIVAHQSTQATLSRPVPVL